MANKTKLSWTDKFFWWGNIIGTVFMLTSCVPAVPWRWVGGKPDFHQRFAGARSYSLFTAGNQYGQPVAWMKLKVDTCRRLTEFNTPNPASMVTGMGLGLMASVSPNLAPGAAWAGCAAWDVCKAHVAQRCSSYGVFSGIGVGCFLLTLFGGVAAAMGAVFMTKEQAIKKKKKKEEAQMNVALASTAAFVLPLCSTVIWLGMSSMLFSNLGSTSFYPFPTLGPGAYLALVGLFILLIAMIAGIWRQDKYKSDEEEEEEEPTVYEPSQMGPMGFAGPPPPMGFGGGPPPPGYGVPGGYGGPPGGGGGGLGMAPAPGGMPGWEMPKPPRTPSSD